MAQNAPEAEPHLSEIVPDLAPLSKFDSPPPSLNREVTLTNETPEQLQGSTSQHGLVTPAFHKGRTLVLCFDGTGDQFDADNSNIVELFTTLSKDDPDKQMVYYQAGIGTYTSPQIATPFFAKVSKALDEAIAWNLDAHIMDGYEFLMQNYRANDRICIFGFSRGAYTARWQVNLAGMIHKVGLLPACNHQQVPFAYKMYTQPDAVGWKQSNAFKKAFSIDVDIEFLGVWDTVNSVGLIPRRLPFTTSNTIVRTFRHAVSLDERRAKFKANLWNRPEGHECMLSISDQEKARREKSAKVGLRKNTNHVHLHEYESQYSTARATPTDIEEVWFAGCHCDVGGGSVTNETKQNLARISLRWMIRECFRRESGILFKLDGLHGIGLDPAALFPLVLPRPPALSPGSADYIQQIPKDTPSTSDGDTPPDVAAPSQTMTEEEHELRDALSPVYDQLLLRFFWWIGEIIPMYHRYQKGDNTWTWSFRWNWGRGRVVPRQKEVGVKVHRSVKIRMDAAYEGGRKYTPKVTNLDMDRVIWVD